LYPTHEAPPARLARRHTIQWSNPLITSLTGIGDVLGAEFLAATRGSPAGFASADHLASYCGLAAAPHDSGYRTGNLR
jgi:transposase